MKVIFILLAALMVAACASTPAAEDSVRKDNDTAEKTENSSKSAADWQLRYGGTTPLTQLQFECVFKTSEGEQVGYRCDVPGTKFEDYRPLSGEASADLIQKYAAVDWDAELSAGSEESVGGSSVRFTLERKGGAVQISRPGQMSDELEALEFALLSSVRVDQADYRSEKRTEGVCDGACEEGQWCEVRKGAACYTPEGGDDGVDGTLGSCEKKPDEPVCSDVRKPGDACDRHEQCAPYNCVGIIAPMCAQSG